MCSAVEPEKMIHQENIRIKLTARSVTVCVGRYCLPGKCCCDRVELLQIERGRPMQLSGKQKLSVLLGVLLLLVIVRWILPDPGGDAVTITDMQADSMQQMEEETMPAGTLVVHVAGAVQHPGVYTLQDGQRVEDAILLAGLAEEADADALNRAELLMDGQKIVVPFKSDLTGSDMTQSSDTRISINEADTGQLTALPGIGTVRANAIVQYRTQHGRFRSIEDIQQVDGIGAGTFEQIKNQIKI